MSSGGTLVDTFLVVESVEKVALCLDLSLAGHDGRLAFGGHVIRISGARHLAVVRIDLRRYVRDSPLVALTDTYNRVQHVS